MIPNVLIVLAECANLIKLRSALTASMGTPETLNLQKVQDRIQCTSSHTHCKGVRHIEP